MAEIIPLREGCGVRLAPLLFLLPLACVTLSDGSKQVDREKCAQTVEAARAALLACAFIEGEDDESVQNRERCKAGAEIALASAKLGCTFAEDQDGSED